MANERHRCPVCGWDGLDRPAWVEDAAADEICPCCGTQWGLDDAVPGGVEGRVRRHAELRARWVEDGAVWWSSTPAPPGWDAGAQLGGPGRRGRAVLRLGGGGAGRARGRRARRRGCCGAPGSRPWGRRTGPTARWSCAPTCHRAGDGRSRWSSTTGGPSTWWASTPGSTRGGPMPGWCGPAGSSCGRPGCRSARWPRGRSWSRSTPAPPSATVRTPRPACAWRPSTGSSFRGRRSSTWGAGAGCWPSPPCCWGRRAPSASTSTRRPWPSPGPPPSATASPTGSTPVPSPTHRTGRAAIVVANIGAAVLRELAPLLVARVAPGGALVVSGLLDPAACGRGRRPRPAGGRGRRAGRRLDRPHPPLTRALLGTFSYRSGPKTCRERRRRAGRVPPWLDATRPPSVPSTGGPRCRPPALPSPSPPAASASTAAPPPCWPTST